MTSSIYLTDYFQGNSFIALLFRGFVNTAERPFSNKWNYGIVVHILIKDALFELFEYFSHAQTGYLIEKMDKKRIWVHYLQIFIFF